MRRIAAILLLFFVWSCTPSTHQTQISIDEVESFQPTLVLMNPTAFNLSVIIDLMDKGVLPLPTNTKILGVYHALAANSYKQSEEFLSKKRHKHIKLLEISAELNPMNLYTNNDCSPIFQEIFKHSKGVFFMGGPDLPPSTYSKPTNLLTVITDVHRHYLELSFLFHLLGGNQNDEHIPLLEENPEYSVLGICLGMQTMNVATGGTMVQDIPTELYEISTAEDVLQLEKNMIHRNYHSNFGTHHQLIPGNFHKISYKENSLFDQLNLQSEKRPHVWSNHHQAVGLLGKGIKPIAWSVDNKVVEAVIHKDYPNVLGVQFHPEALPIFENNALPARFPDDDNQKSFKELYPAETGELFHNNFWVAIGEKLINTAN